jgi:hypothetical protein
MAAAQFNVPYAEVSKPQRSACKQAWFMLHFERNRNNEVHIERTSFSIGEPADGRRLFGAWISPEELPIFTGGPSAYEGFGITPAAALRQLADAIPAAGKTRAGWPTQEGPR